MFLRLLGEGAKPKLVRKISGAEVRPVEPFRA